MPVGVKEAVRVEKRSDSSVSFAWEEFDKGG
jgi:hypothetical protein